MSHPTPKLSEIQRRALKRIAGYRREAEPRTWRAVAERLLRMGLVEHNLSGYEGLFVITPAGRAALTQGGDDGE